jgi:hypothetical protein
MISAGMNSFLPCGINEVMVKISALVMGV